MTRPTMRTVRDNIDAITINKTGLANDQCYKRRILQREFEATGNLATSQRMVDDMPRQDMLVIAGSLQQRDENPKLVLAGSVRRCATQQRRNASLSDGGIDIIDAQVVINIQDDHT